MNGVRSNSTSRKPATLQDALSISLGLSSSFGNGSTASISSPPPPHGGFTNRDSLNLSHNIDNYLSRSFAGSSIFNKHPNSGQPILTDADDELEGQTEFIAENDEYYSKNQPSSSSSASPIGVIDEETNLLQSEPTYSAYSQPQQQHHQHQSYSYASTPTQASNSGVLEIDFESQTVVKQSSMSVAFQEIKNDLTVPNVLSYTPAVVLGTLLNILDALSYGMIIFPISDAAFSGLSNTGLSMFYVSCVISQVLFSMGWSQFKAGIGSEMIEVTPFFHSMALAILKELGGDAADQDVVISTTITTYALSSVITGLIFFLLGYYRMGELVGYFPRHILVGCIGGVGYFLIITGIEISGGTGPLTYTLEYFWKLLELNTFCKISLAVAVTVALLLIQLRLTNSLVLPSFYIGVLVLFHFIIIVMPSLTLEDARKAGYLFDTSANSNESWYEFYKLYRLNIVDWWLVVKQVPTILALTFFGILHVPINVPALAVSTKQENDVNVDRELIAHGMSNLVSGLCGSIQNYLVYTNSLLFIRAGADSRVAGLMLAAATFVVLVSGSVIVAVIPVCVVGSLIFILGYELLKEALWDTRNKTGKFEYFTIVVIVVTMGAYDFVGGVFVGVLLAFVGCVADQSRTPVVRKEFTGEIARSTVMRHSLQDSFLSKIGKQIYVLKLQSYLFFGSIGGLEKRIKSLFESQEIRYLILDFTSVLNVDFSASEGLNRIKKVVFEHGAFLIISLGDDKIYAKLDKVNLFDSNLKLKVFKELNSALEWSENEFLLKYKAYKSSTKGNPNSFGDDYEEPLIDSQFIEAQPAASTTRTNSTHLPINTPRNTNFLREASHYLKKENNINVQLLQTTQTASTSPKKDSSNFSKLFLFSSQAYTSQLTYKFWEDLIHKFQRQAIHKGDRLFTDGEDFVMLIDTGSINVSHCINGKKEYTSQETFISRTLFGRVEGMANSTDQLIVTAKRDSTVWVLHSDALAEVKSQHPALFIELLLVLNKVNEKRGRLVTGNTLMSA
ncbi:hypothetical protein WICPIJ_008845 [Wickerhamomyces pijperi]|uniref:STAS domain-containing protein n=1 Tax=Wickerhamomyces pijperi TaxID=599730 RepID=A0A9P8PVG2_WICPI|nr:hypothetical protein WICPIJ_008845 [Wickerhamomyces pijperi]